MAQIEPMDIDNIDSDFDNKENSFHHINVLPRTPCTEKGYEELDVSELNMKLRYSITPASSPMTKSLTSNYLDNRSFDSEDVNNVLINENGNLSHSLNSTVTKIEMIKSPKTLPLKVLSTEQMTESKGASVLRSLEPTLENTNLTITLCGLIDNEDNLSIPSTSPSITQTPEATTPTKEIQKHDGGSPIMRGLKSVLNMFRSSQSPIPPGSNSLAKPEMLTPQDLLLKGSDNSNHQMASTPIGTKHREGSGSQRSSPLKETIVFNNDLERELQWKDETTILFKEEKIPIHKLFPSLSISTTSEGLPVDSNIEQNKKLNTVEYMDISMNDSILQNVTMNVQTASCNETLTVESDGEFVDCETTVNDEYKLSDKVIDDCNKNNVIIQCKELNQNQMITDLSLIVIEQPEEIKNNRTPEDITPPLLEIQDKIGITTELTFNDQNVASCGIENHNDVTAYIVDEQKTLQSTANVTQTVKEDVVLHNDNYKLVSSNKEILNSLHNNMELIKVKLEVSENLDFISLYNRSENKNEITFPNEVPLPDDDDFENRPNSGNGNTTKATKSNEGIIVNEYEINHNVDQEELKKKENQIKMSIDHSELFHINNETEDLSLKCLEQDELNTNNQVVNKKIMDHTDILKLIHEDNVSEIKEEVETPKSVEESLGDIKKYQLIDNTSMMHENNLSKKMAELNKNQNLGKMDNMSIEHSKILVNKAEVISSDIDTKIEIVDSLLGQQNLYLSDDHFNNVELEYEAVVTSAENKDLENFVINHSDFLKCEFDNFEKKRNISGTQDINISKETVELACPTQINNEEHEKTLNQANQIIPVLKENSPDTFDHCTSVNGAQKREYDESKTLVQENRNTTLDRESINICHDLHLNDEKIKMTKDNEDLNSELETHTKSEILLEQLTVSEKVGDIMSENFNTLNAQPIYCVDKTSNTNIDEFGSKECMVRPETCSPTYKQDINAISIESVLQVINVIEDTKELCEHIQNKSEHVISEEITKDKTASESFYNLNINAEMHIVSEIIPDTDAITQPENTDNGRKSMTNSKYLPNTEEDKTLLEPNISNSVNKSKSLSSLVQFANKGCPPNDIILESSRREFQSIDLTENMWNVEMFGRQEQIDTNNIEACQIKSNESKEIANTVNNPTDIPFGDNTETENIEEVHLNKPFVTKANITVSPPLSPVISSKGYNFNFDEVDDPFSTKTKIRMSPPPGSLEDTQISGASGGKGYKKKILNNSHNDFQRRKSQPKKKKSPICKSKINSTFSASPDFPEIKKDNELVKEQDTITLNNADVRHVSIEQVHVPDHSIRSYLQTNYIHASENSEIDINEEFNYTRTDTPSHEDEVGSVDKQKVLPIDIIESKNVFNLPEMSGAFITKSKICRSPPPGMEIEGIAAVEFKAPNDLLRLVHHSLNSDSNYIIEGVDHKQIAGNIEHDSSAGTSSSKATEDATVREVNTEDEDTAEGPFFETEDFNYSDEMCDNGNMMNFSEIAARGGAGCDGNAEMFIDAEAFEFLLNQNKRNVVADSGKESLFLKFDPLFAKRMSSDGVLGNLSKIQKSMSTPKRISKAPAIDFTYCEKTFPSPSPSNLNKTTEINDTLEVNFEDPNILVSKPMMVVNPAMNSIVTPRSKSNTPPRANRRSLTLTSPAIAVIDRLLSLSGNDSTLNHETTINNFRREQNETDQALTQLRELLAEKEIHVHNLRTESKELRDRLSTLESQVRTLETESVQRLRKVNELNECLAEKTKMNRNMAAVVEEYERTIASLIAEIEQDKKLHAEERLRLQNERDEQTSHLTSMEYSFNDLHSKYEKSKQIILSCKANQEAYMKSIKEFEESLVKMQNNYELLKQHATSKLNHANQEFERLNKAHEAELLKLSAMIKRKELHITSLEETLAQKTKANEELTAICDELINKVG